MNQASHGKNGITCVLSAMSLTRAFKPIIEVILGVLKGELRLAARPLDISHGVLERFQPVFHQAVALLFGQRLLNGALGGVEVVVLQVFDALVDGVDVRLPVDLQSLRGIQCLKGVGGAKYSTKSR